MEIKTTITWRQTCDIKEMSEGVCWKDSNLNVLNFDIERTNSMKWIFYNWNHIKWWTNLEEMYLVHFKWEPQKSHMMRCVTTTRPWVQPWHWTINWVRSSQKNQKGVYNSLFPSSLSLYSSQSFILKWCSLGIFST